MSYEPRLSNVGNSLSGKVLLSDGTRFYDFTAGALDFDPSPAPEHFSSFLDSGPIFHGSVAYGRTHPRNGTDPNRTNLKLSFRHGDGVNAVMFDGSVRAVKRADAWTKVDLWHPSGSRFMPGGVATPESMAVWQTNQVVP